ncbi:MAG: hypothetical protein FWG68_11780 [Defluviitaleaceae bacterium]|nr:hypothetical protein [Defluviitaleaceae bacterium]
MNLLPAKIVRTRQLSRQLSKLAVVQAGILLLFGAVLLVFSVAESGQQVHAQTIAQQMQDDRFSQSEAMSTVLQEHHARGHYEQSISQHLNLPAFDVDKLYKMTETLPTGVILLNVNVDENGATLNLQTTSLTLADLHRDNWLNTGLVERVQMTSATVTENAHVRYVLALAWRYES